MTQFQKTKVDIFIQNTKEKNVKPVLYGERIVNIASIEDQLVKTVLDTQKVFSGNKLNPKQISDTKSLIQIADMQKADNIWRSYEFKNYPKTITEAIERVEKIAATHPE